MTEVDRRSGQLDVWFADADRHAVLLDDPESDYVALINAPEDAEGFLDRHDLAPEDVSDVFVTDFEVDQTDAFETLASANDDLNFFVPDVPDEEIEDRIEDRKDELRERERTTDGRPGNRSGFGPGRGEDRDIDPDADPEVALLQSELENSRAFARFAHEADVNVASLAEGQEVRGIAGSRDENRESLGFGARVVSPPVRATRATEDANVRSLALHVTATHENGSFDGLFTGRLDPEATDFVIENLARLTSQVRGTTDIESDAGSPDFDVVDYPEPPAGDDVSRLVTELEPAVAVRTDGGEPSEAELEAAEDTGTRVAWRGMGGDVYAGVEFRRMFFSNAVTPSAAEERLDGEETERSLSDHLAERTDDGDGETEAETGDVEPDVDADDRDDDGNAEEMV